MMTIPPPFLLLKLLLAVAHSAADSSAAPSPAPAPATEFIRTSCETTQYPSLCYNSLAGYANAVHQDPARLAKVAIGLSLCHAAGMTSYLSNLSRRASNDLGAANPRAAAALRDCFSVFGDAVDQIRGSMQQMRRLTGAGEELRFQMSNVQTWMSAALTNEDTCMDGFEGVADGTPVKDDVCDRTVKVKEATSNALALVNSYAAKIMVP